MIYYVLQILIDVAEHLQKKQEEIHYGNIESIVFSMTLIIDCEVIQILSSAQWTKLEKVRVYLFIFMLKLCYIQYTVGWAECILFIYK